jgi:hypothetical protein
MDDGMDAFQPIENKRIAQERTLSPVWSNVSAIEINEIYKTKGLAERVGFEPTIPVKVYTLSKRAPSATRPSLRERHNHYSGRKILAPATALRFRWTTA